MKIFDGKNERIVVEYNSLQEAGLHPNTKLEELMNFQMVIIHMMNFMNLEKCIMLHYLMNGLYQ